MKVLVFKFQRIILPSQEQLKSKVSSIFIARDVTESSWPFKVAIKIFRSVFHALIVLSLDPLYKIIPFDSNKAHKTPSVCSLRFDNSYLAWISHKSI